MLPTDMANASAPGIAVVGRQNNDQDGCKPLASKVKNATSGVPERVLFRAQGYGDVGHAAPFSCEAFVRKTLVILVPFSTSAKVNV